MKEKLTHCKSTEQLLQFFISRRACASVCVCVLARARVCERACVLLACSSFYPSASLAIVLICCLACRAGAHEGVAYTRSLMFCCYIVV